jgi:hypothetical protein
MRMQIRQGRRFCKAPPQAALPAGGNQEPTRFAETPWPVARVGTDENDRIMHRVGAVAVAAQILVHGRPFPFRALSVRLAEAVPRAPMDVLQYNRRFLSSTFTICRRWTGVRFCLYTAQTYSIIGDSSWHFHTGHRSS